MHLTITARAATLCCLTTFAHSEDISSQQHQQEYAAHNTSTIIQAPQPWMSHMDLMSAGAAASVVLHHGCMNANASNAAAQRAAERLQTIAMATSNPEHAYTYASSSFDLKVKAMWQSTQGRCSNMQTLQHIASGTGFPTP